MGRLDVLGGVPRDGSIRMDGERELLVGVSSQLSFFVDGLY
jgi:hypothetical protein